MALQMTPSGRVSRRSRISQLVISWRQSARVWAWMFTI